MDLNISAGSELRIEVLPVADQVFPITWSGELHLKFTPNVEFLQLQASRVYRQMTRWDEDQSVIRDGRMPALWYFPVRQCSYGLLTILCPNRPHPILTATYGESYMQPNLCHHCENASDITSAWWKIAEQTMERPIGNLDEKEPWTLSDAVVGEGAKAGGFGVKVEAIWYDMSSQLDASRPSMCDYESCGTICDSCNAHRMHWRHEQ